MNHDNDDNHNVGTEQSPLEDEKVKGNDNDFETDLNFSPDNDGEETYNKDNINPILTYNDNDDGNNTDINNHNINTEPSPLENEKAEEKKR